MKNGFLSNLTKTFLYLSSFLPLFLLLIVQNIELKENREWLNWSNFFSQFFSKGFGDSKTIFWIAVIIFVFLSIISIGMFFCIFVRADGTPGHLLGTNFERADTLGYIVSYIVPLVSMDINSYRSLLINFSLFFIIGIFYIKNNQFFMNPIFNLLGYNILASDSGCIYVTKLSPRRMKEISIDEEDVILKYISDDIYLVKEL